MAYAGFFKPFIMVALFEPFDRRFFDNRLAVADAEQIRAQAMPFHREFVVFADPVFQRQRLDAVKKFRKRVRFKCAEHNQNPFRKSRAEIGARKQVFVAFKKDTSVFRRDRFGAYVAQFVCDKTL